MVNFNRALELRAGYGEARSNRGWVYVEQKRWREAREDFEQALKSDPQDEGALYGLSQVLKEARDYAGAAQALRSLMARSPNFVWLRLRKSARGRLCSPLWTRTVRAAPARLCARFTARWTAASTCSTRSCPREG
ncbi:MAG: tetratricopeptide repeat protein [Deltaproteobacteria bacterium]|nr:tetratricopeptide repeat protein [Deltaproteobacteria bacterium]